MLDPQRQEIDKFPAVKISGLFDAWYGSVLVLPGTAYRQIYTRA